MPDIFRHKPQDMGTNWKAGSRCGGRVRPGLGWRCSLEKVPVKPRARTQQTAAVENGSLEWRGQGGSPQDLCRPSPHQLELLDGQQRG